MEDKKQNEINYPEYVAELKEFASDEELEKFFTRLNFNYGGGTVLSKEQVESFFHNNLHKSDTQDILTLYIDTIRMLRLFDKNENDIIGLNETGIKHLHDTLSSEYKGSVDDIKSAEFKKATSPFLKLNGEYGNIKVELIASLRDLNHEGTRMNHCIATYSDIIIRKHYLGFRVYNKKTGERLTLGCFRNPDDDNLYFNQLKGWGNCPAKKESCVAIIEFCKAKGITITESESYDLMLAFIN